MIDAPIGLAFAAGMVATVNPCGFAMLPAYLAYFMGLEDAEDGRAGTVEALRVGGIVSLAFVSVFGVTGLLINAGLRSIIDWIPYLALAVGVVMLVLGVAMFRGYELNLRLLKTSGGGATRDNRSIFGFGVSYAVASLSCTLPVFLSVVVGSIATASFASGLATYLAYGLGMSTLLVAVTLALAFAKQGFVRRLRSMLRYVQRVSAGFLVVAGLYIIWFWVDDLSSDAGEQGRAAGIVEGWSATVTNWIQANAVTVGLVVGGSVVLALMAVLLRRFEPVSDPSEATHETAAAEPVSVTGGDR